MTQHSLPQTRIIPLPRLAANGRWRVEAMRSLSEPCILNFTKGMGRITVSGVTRGYAAGTVVYIPSGAMHGFEVGPQVLGTALFLGHNPGLELPPAPLHIRLRDVVAQQEITMMLDMITRELDSHSAAGARAAMHYIGLLSVWLERQADAAGFGERTDLVPDRVIDFPLVVVIEILGDFDAEQGWVGGGEERGAGEVGQHGDAGE